VSSARKKTCGNRCRRLATFFDFRQTYAYLNSICRDFV
jgi:hypothetical protein